MSIELFKYNMISETKENFTSMRAQELEFLDRELYLDLERSFGKYLFVPFDIPNILPNDIERFVNFFFTQAGSISKRISDFSSKVNSIDPANSYLSINSVSPNWTGGSFTTNPCPEAYIEFPELFEQIHDYMPFVGGKDFRWSMWSSRANVPLHRDLTSMIDAPTAIRIKLVDTNPFETLSLILDPVDKEVDHKFSLPILSDTNSFAWNNLRTKHKSVYLKHPTNAYRKILFIVREEPKTAKEINQYVDLLEKSIAKYKKETVIDTITTISDYLHVH